MRVKANAAKQVVDPVQVNGDIVRLAISWCDWQLALPKTIRNAAFFRRAVDCSNNKVHIRIRRSQGQPIRLLCKCLNSNLELPGEEKLLSAWPKLAWGR